MKAEARTVIIIEVCEDSQCVVVAAEVAVEISESLRCAVGMTSTWQNRGTSTGLETMISAKAEVADASTTTHKVQDTVAEVA